MADADLRQQQRRRVFVGVALAPILRAIVGARCAALLEARSGFGQRYALWSRRTRACTTTALHRDTRSPLPAPSQPPCSLCAPRCPSRTRLLAPRCRSSAPLAAWSPANRRCASRKRQLLRPPRALYPPGPVLQHALPRTAPPYPTCTRPHRAIAPLLYLIHSHRGLDYTQQGASSISLPSQQGWLRLASQRGHWQLLHSSHRTRPSSRLPLYRCATALR